MGTEPRMNILIGLHHVTLGGDTINAVELASRLRSRGHRVTLFAITGATGAASAVEAPLLAMAGERGVGVRIFPRPLGVRARLGLVRDLARFARAERVEVVHAFGHQDTYFAFAGSYGLAGVPLVVNDYAMTLTRGLPQRVPLIAGTAAVRDEAERERPGPAFLLEPPVDIVANRPGCADGAAFRRRLGIGPDEVLLVMVSRLARTMKAESLRGAIDAVWLLAEPAVRLVLVGDGDGAPDLGTRAAKVNADLGRDAVLLPGAMVDPRPAYAAADIVLGMGHSGLRGMAFGKPLVVVGERGFSLPLTRETLSQFLYHGVYGLGDGGDVAPGLAEQLRPLLRDRQLREARGQLGRQTVMDRFGLDAAAERLEAIYRSVAGRRRSLLAWARDAGALAATYAPAKIRRMRRSRRG
jgi:glycosyltransferase involved in cell wall biosynthesis